MNEIKDFLLTKGYELKCIEDNQHYLFTKTIEELDFIFLLIAPHEGNNYHYIFRCDTVINHDRWSNCDFERSYLDVEDFKQNWNLWLLFN